MASTTVESGEDVQVPEHTPTVLGTKEAREQLPALLRGLARSGKRARALFIGRRRKPEAVVLSVAAYEGLLEELDNLAALAVARERIETRRSEPVDIDEVAGELGLTLPDEE
jgi:PHD/YefM family antitoxin component YafN of YafNO toxin-antitoxin module